MGEPERVQTLNEKQNWYWKKNIKFISGLLVIWFLVGLGGGVLFAAPLNEVPFFGVTLSFWIGHQGAILVFILLILSYAIRMDKLDREYFEKKHEN
ncbi:DUF4212 domain-containing protein [Aquibacillus koreensis]|uniref:DUF4212 domain-containing protein n=1 Tax=Aquibacillus koreensis TaxID=279446 RepID=A0A9X4AK86_9BACI|nr:DUF4212 domain-containing protein [Aquibacillus koreensis]MCT2537835.1 DUF4212 domain-containing protein [Aquibacillus koreensis]MDC3421133.1 DUF4212 domain-containing protein [Aquibacillus koreensis]